MLFFIPTSDENVSCMQSIASDFKCEMLYKLIDFYYLLAFKINFYTIFMLFFVYFNFYLFYFLVYLDLITVTK